MSRARLLLLCPGQGDQHPGMFDLARTNAAANALADRLLSGRQLDGDIYANRIAQPLIVTATLSMWEAIRDFAPTPALVAGYSIGELSAYGVAGAIAPAQAVALAAQRAQWMDDCQRIVPGQALLTITGLTLASASKLAAQYGYHISIETGEDSCIAGGPAAQADQLQQAIEAAGARSRRLPVAVASHTPYMQSAVQPFGEALEATTFMAQLAPVLAGIDASAIRDKARAVETLSRQLAEKIRWLACMDAADEAGITVALELGPGSALSKMLQQRHPHINTRSVADFRTLDGIARWLERAAEDA
ncbi:MULTISPECIES: acyltransferase domain-containing protein [unclassified Duganella]|jgi:[acyl-carrier-protein] S-malonyltransferase|uniref:acyltransferase domain-containing protein n=1 Tax=unclassified Duganella TaxID=2636909 RepID=UPI00088108AA|nr:MULTISPECIES: acyltransferase domain-containing protein [unclassified Duganella]SDG52069.1 [acyl-carrier-protein] S-malonyltransferase [Duganella sp. OV458]SDJ74806.1 [acyl-carrier-protein] S-malonyltransferase [Duganella sp. OV510]